MYEEFRKNLSAFAIAIAMLFAVPMFAAAESEEMEVTEEEAAELIDEAVEEVAEATEYVEEEDEGEDLLEYAEDYLASAEDAYDDEDYGEAAEWAEKAIAKAEYIMGEDDDEKDYEDKDDDHDKLEDKDYDKDHDHKEDKDYKDYGQSDDIAELQAQLRELLQLMIQLLTIQLAAEAL